MCCPMFLYLLPGLLFLPSCLSSCPPSCHCSSPAGGQYSLLCMAANLTRIPALQPSSKPVQVMNMDSNNLTVLPSFAFFHAGLQDLLKLSLRNCNINLLPENFFYGLTSLQDLNLSGNLLTSLLPHQFSQLKSLTSLDLSHNALSTIPGTALSSLSLSHLSLTGNVLTTLPFSTFPLLISLKQLQLSANPWNCDSRLAALHAELVKMNAVPGQTMCRTPLVLLDSLWSDLLSSDFVSKPSMSVHHKVISWPGQTVSLTCNVTGNTATEVVWLAGARVILNNSFCNLDTDPLLYQHCSIRLTETRSSEYSSTFHSVLTIMNMSLGSGAAQYGCLATNKAGMEQKQVLIRLGETSPQINVVTAVSASIIVILLVIIISIVTVWKTSRLGLKSSNPKMSNITTKCPEPIPTSEDHPVALSRQTSDQTVILADDQPGVTSDSEEEGWMAGDRRSDSYSTGYESLLRAGSDHTGHTTIPKCGSDQTGNFTLPRCGNFPAGNLEFSPDGNSFYPLISNQPGSRASIGTISFSPTDQAYSSLRHHHSHPPYRHNHHPARGYVTLPRRRQSSYNLPPYLDPSSNQQPYNITIQPSRLVIPHQQHPDQQLQSNSTAKILPKCKLGTISEQE